MSYANYSSKDYRTIARIFAEVRNVLINVTRDCDGVASSISPDRLMVLSLVEDSMVRMFAEDNDRFKENLFREAARAEPLAPRFDTE